jgi:hypothetical protein
MQHVYFVLLQALAMDAGVVSNTANAQCILQG